MFHSLTSDQRRVRLHKRRDSLSSIHTLDAYGGVVSDPSRPDGFNLFPHGSAVPSLPRGSPNVLNVPPGPIIPPTHLPYPKSWYSSPSTSLSDPAFSTDPRLNPHYAFNGDHLLRPGGRRRHSQPQPNPEMHTLHSRSKSLKSHLLPIHAVDPHNPQRYHHPQVYGLYDPNNASASFSTF